MRVRPVPFFSKIGIAAAGLAIVLSSPAASQQAGSTSGSQPALDSELRRGTVGDGASADTTGSIASAAPPSETTRTSARDVLEQVFGKTYLEHNPLTASVEKPPEAETAPETAPPHSPEDNPFEPTGIRIEAERLRAE